MKYADRTLLQILHKLDLERTAVTASCSRATICPEDKDYAREAVAHYRSVSKDIVYALRQLTEKIHGFDIEVETSFTSARQSWQQSRSSEGGQSDRGCRHEKKRGGNKR
jgi:hypothetical protein